MKETDVRQLLVEALEADLIGPFVPDAHSQGGQEVLPIAPSRWYLTGFLAPQGSQKPDEDDQESVDGGLAAGSEIPAEDAGTEEPEPKRPVRFPASMGLSVFLPPGKADALDVDVWYADYDKIDISLDRDDKKYVGWKRVPHGPVRVSVPLDPKALQTGAGIPVPLSRGLVLRGELRTTEMEGLEPGTRVLSLFLVNGRAAEKKDRDLQFVFQVRMALSYGAGFRPRPNRRGEDGGDEDQRVLALAFRDRMEWAVGHNTSVMLPEKVGGKVTRLETTQLPRFEVPRVDHRPVEDVTTGMADLSKLDGKGLANALSPLAEAYGKWLDGQRSVPLERDPLEKTRADLMNKAQRAKERIEEGIALLAFPANAQVLRAFQLANKAMGVAALQADKTREDPRYVNGKQPEWRPFQLAFLLMNLPSVVDPAHKDRKLAELIYFPTGGGKTEAYLGLIAIVLLLRRLRGKGTAHEGRGVAVLLRYTLRLLTLDQLGRAATLICALEELRRRYPEELGNARFTVGLWVGASATANRLKDVHLALSDYTSGRTDSPFPLASCPWCGESIKIQNIKLVDLEGRPTKKNFARAAVYCDGTGCLYAEAKVPGLGLPVLFVDEQIYQEVPSFLVATVDKYAMMPWRGDAGMLFGRATHLTDQRAYGVMHEPPLGARALPEGLLPPELVVQDELHLISGPLGTLVGLYEAAVDYLCERPFGGKAWPPKVICSTATVRRAREQIQALFGRPMNLFPPRGVTDGDNFFSRVLENEPGRLYVGVGAPGRALRAVSVRSYATLLAAARKHFDPKGDPKQPADPYMTLVGYFNSLRELGGMRRLVEDEVSNRVGDIEEEKRPRLFVGPHPWAADRKLVMPAELTSREPTSRVKETKQRLAARRTSTDPEALDVVLASNMISVGLDIDRLGLMVVTGQPKTTSEYIQATSRVGRAYPGLVVACLNVMRPRDRSHYERFVAYHESFYREVEATSVTPFSGQALDRGLVGALLSMLRHAIPELESPTGIMNLHDKRPAAEQILAWLVTRARGHRNFYDADAEERIAGQVRARGKSFFDAWERVVDKARAGATRRTYSDNDRAGNEGKPVLFTAEQDPPPDHDERTFQVPTSMRDVEPSAHVWLRFKHLDEKGLMAGKKQDARKVHRPDGQIRQSQLVTTFGPGAMVDFVDRAVVIGGLEHWGYGKNGYVALDDPRLRRSLVPRLKALDPDLDLAREGYFRMAPEGDARDPWPNVGVRALEFPRWFVCHSCRRLARAAEAFENKSGRYRHQCAKNKVSSAVPVRFVAACKRGHLSDFPWSAFAHQDREGGDCDRPELYLVEKALGDISRILVQCRNCSSEIPLSRGTVLPYKCSGDRPWLGGRAANEKCDMQSELLVRTASHAYFAQVVSALRLPEADPDPLRLRLRAKDVWKTVQNVTKAEELAMLVKLVEHVRSALEGHPLDAAIAAIRAENASADAVAERPLRSAEFDRLVNAPLELPGIQPDPGVLFAAYRVPKNKVDLPPGVRGLVVVPELREVRVQVSFSRFDSIGANLQGEYDFEGRSVKPAVLTLPTGNEKWLPAAEVRGEGVFVELDDAAVRAWEERPAVKVRAEQLEKAFKAENDSEFPGVRFYLLHSLSHLLLTAVSLECGYAASAIRERIYCGQAEANGPNMAAIMLTTGTTGSEGTLGGLVEEGRRIRHHLREAWDLGRLCSNDPVCAAHDPSAEGSDRHTEGAACHGCLYIAECSCERFNRFLDRALVVPTIGNDSALAFFGERP